jgi:hypothetical protein
LADGESIKLDSLESALNIAGAYENELEVLILMKRICCESDDVKSLERHLDEARSFHQNIRKSRIGAQEWNNFCRMELILIQRLNEECMETIQKILHLLEGDRQ